MARELIGQELSRVFKEISVEVVDDIEVYKTAGYPGKYHSPSLLRLSRKTRGSIDLPTLSHRLTSTWVPDHFAVAVATNGFINFEATSETIPESSDEEGDTFEHVPTSAIGVVSGSTFIDKWGTPRQGQLAPDSISTITLKKRMYLDSGSSCIVFWVPHLNRNNPTKALVRPPKAIGIKVGVFATRSPHRPSPVCMSVCTVVCCSAGPDETVIQVSGADMTLETPILNIMPYFQQHCISDSQCPKWVSGAQRMHVFWTLASFMNIQKFGVETRSLVEKALAEDPRSAHSINRQKIPVHAMKINLHANSVAVTYQYCVDDSGEFIRVLRVGAHDNTVGKLRTKEWLQHTIKTMPFINSC